MTFEFDGSTYRDFSSHQRQWGSQLIESLDLCGTENVLDLGCGDGSLTSILAENLPNGHVLGVDASEGMISAASELRSENIDFQLADIDTLQILEKYDVIFSNAALHWAHDHATLLQRCIDALVPEGILRFQFAAHGNCSNLIAVLREIMDLPEFCSQFENFEWPWYMPRASEYERVLKNYSFREFRAWEERVDTVFENSGDLAGWIEQPSIVPFVAHLPSPANSRFSELVVDRMEQRTQRKDGSYVEIFNRLNVFAVK